MMLTLTLYSGHCYPGALKSYRQEALERLKITGHRAVQLCTWAYLMVKPVLAQSGNPKVCSYFKL